MPFGQPIIWREPKDHVSDCYFCLTDVKGFSKKSKHTVNYTEVSSLTKPMPHSEDIPVPKPPSHVEGSSTISNSDDECEDFQVASTSKSPHLISQSKLNDLVRDLDLRKEKSELLVGICSSHRIFFREINDRLNMKVLYINCSMLIKNWVAISH
ncbi:unnamed protein product [Euphydryas editha]|uniref:Uncharacterized protein n=1 Tax=Euphydryas editha TaxID=104508 RepID=A0AAU9TR19_EUPED|nr:unnamed protein product [Euphydryas editha]